MSPLAIIGGTGLARITSLTIERNERITTPYGAPSADYIIGALQGKPVVFLARHGNPHLLAPHRINYRANLFGLKHLGVKTVIAVAAVGGITEVMAPAISPSPTRSSTTVTDASIPFSKTTTSRPVTSTSAIRTARRFAPG